MLKLIIYTETLKNFVLNTPCSKPSLDGIDKHFGSYVEHIKGEFEKHGWQVKLEFDSGDPEMMFFFDLEYVYDFCTIYEHAVNIIDFIDEKTA